MSRFGRYREYSSDITCPKCDQKGIIRWEEVTGAESARRDLARIEGDFYERLAKKEPYPIELVCNTCGTAQPEAPLEELRPR